jgi:hypothetical protein
MVPMVYLPPFPASLFAGPGRRSHRPSQFAFRSRPHVTKASKGDVPCKLSGGYSYRRYDGE